MDVDNVRSMSNHQRRSFSRQALKESLDRATLRVTIASTFVAVVAALAAIWSGYEARQTRLDSERPFVFVDPLNRGADGSSIRNGTMRTQIRAFDKSAARNVLVTCLMFVDGSQSRTTWTDAAKTQPVLFPYLLPTQWVAIYCPATPAVSPQPQSTVVELGTVTYDDDRENHYLTPFCYTYIFVPDRDLDIASCNENRGLPNLQ
jgi:hypothetical protein